MRELASYHALPHVTIDELEKTNNLQELLTKVDLKSAEKSPSKKF